MKTRSTWLEKPVGWIFPALVLVASQPLLAHLEEGQAEGLVAGLSHPVSGLDHVLAMVAVGLWGGQLGAPAIWVLPVAFPMVMAFGGMMGLLGFELPGTEIGIAVSALVLGAMVLLEKQPNLQWAALLVAFFAIFHGYAHGTELPEGANGLLYSIGFVAATGTLHGLGILLGLVHRWLWGRLAIRLSGLCVLLAGLYFLWRAIL